MAITKIDIDGGKSWVWDGEGTFTTQLAALTGMKVGAKCIGPNLDKYEYSADGWIRTSTGGAASVNPQPGTQKQARNRYLANVSTTAASFETVDWPSGANITELNIFCTPTTPEAAQTGDYGIIVIDAASDAIAELMLTQTESASDDVQWYPIPPNEIVRIPLTAALSNGQFSGGRVDCLSVGIAMDFWIGAS